MIRVFAVLLSLAIPSFSLADAGQPSCGFLQTVYSPFSFPEVEYISRQHAIGLYRGGPVTLNPRIEISDKAVVGLDGEGRVLSVIRLKNRTIARLLSGDRKICDLFLRAPGQLIAVDRDGRLLEFGWPAWQKSPVKAMVWRKLKSYGLSVCNLGMGAMLLSYWLETPVDSAEIALAFGAGSVSSLLLHAFMGAAEFTRLNDNTDGFHETGSRVAGFRRSEFIRNDQGVIEDFEILGASGAQRLSELIPLLPVNPDDGGFDFACEEEFLPAGIPPSAYEPTL